MKSNGGASKKAATLVLSLGTDRAQSVLKHLSDEDVRALASEVAELGQIDTTDYLSVLRETVDATSGQVGIRRGGREQARKLLATRRGLSDEELAHMTGGRPFAFIHEVEAEQLTQFLKAEHPQTAALILAYQRPSFAAQVLAQLEPEMRVDIALRIATMGRTSRDVITSVERALRSRLDSSENEATAVENGPKGLADILNNSDRSIEKAVLEFVGKFDEELAEHVRALMFVFEDLVKLDDRSIQEVLKNVDTKTLAVALKGASEDVTEAITRNLSERARESLDEEVELLGPVLRKDVEAAGTQIVALVRTLEADGQIVVSRSEGDFIE